MTADVTAANTN